MVSDIPAGDGRNYNLFYSVGKSSSGIWPFSVSHLPEFVGKNEVVDFKLTFRGLQKAGKSL